MSTYIISQATYTVIECALYVDNACVETITIDKKSACTQLMPALNDLIEKNKLAWNSLDFIGVNQGPAPFTTLRVVIATINGIAFATHVPLIGVDGLHTFLTALTRQQDNVILLNAFNNDAYYAYHNKNEIKTGCAPIAHVLKELRMLNKTLIFAGMGSELFKEEILRELGARAKFLEPACAYTPLDAVARACLSAYNTGTRVQQLSPLYLKQPIANV